MQRRLCFSWVGYAFVLVALLPFVYGPRWVMAMLNPNPASSTALVTLTLLGTQPDPEAEYDAMFAEFWDWAWSDDDAENGCMVMVQQTSTKWRIEAYAPNTSGQLTLIGAGTLVVSGWQTLHTQATQHFDPESQRWIASNVTASKVTGVMTNPALQTRSIVGAVILGSGETLNPPANQAQVYSFMPVSSAADVDGAFMQMGGGVVQCPEGVPYEQLPCRCKCQVDRANCESVCAAGLEGGVAACVTVGGTVIFVCYIGCLLAGPGFAACIWPCLAGTLKATAKCVAIALSLYGGCMATCHVLHEHCMDNCP